MSSWSKRLRLLFISVTGLASAIFFLVVGSARLYYGVPNLYHAITSPHWPTVQSVITYSNVLSWGASASQDNRTGFKTSNRVG
jgi:hypothetical protein